MRASSRLALLLASAPLTLALALAPSAANAQDDPARLEQARDLYRAGVTAFRARRFGEAVVSFERSFRLRPHPTTLYNAAEARLRAGDRERALEQLRDLLAMRDPAPDADTQERARTLAREAGEPSLQPTPPAPACPPVRECPAPTPCPDCPPPRATPAPAGALPITLVVGGAVVLATGAGFYAAALADSGVYNNPNTPVSVRLGLRDQGQAFTAVGIAGLLVGLAAEVVGVYLLARPPAPPPPRASSAANQPITARIEVLPGGLGLSGTF